MAAANNMQEKAVLTASIPSNAEEYHKALDAAMKERRRVTKVGLATLARVMQSTFVKAMPLFGAALTGWAAGASVVPIVGAGLGPISGIAATIAGASVGAYAGVRLLNKGWNALTKRVKQAASLSPLLHPMNMLPTSGAELAWRCEQPNPPAVRLAQGATLSYPDKLVADVHLQCLLGLACQGVNALPQGSMPVESLELLAAASRKPARDWTQEDAKTILTVSAQISHTLERNGMTGIYPHDALASIESPTMEALELMTSKVYPEMDSTLSRVAAVMANGRRQAAAPVQKTAPVERQHYAEQQPGTISQIQNAEMPADSACQPSAPDMGAAMLGAALQNTPGQAAPVQNMGYQQYPEQPAAPMQNPAWQQGQGPAYGFVQNPAGQNGPFAGLDDMFGTTVNLLQRFGKPAGLGGMLNIAKNFIKPAEAGPVENAGPRQW